MYIAGKQGFVRNSLILLLSLANICIECSTEGELIQASGKLLPGLKGRTAWN